MDLKGSFGIVLTREIEAAHFLFFYEGKPEPVHGHTWKIEVLMEAPVDHEGMSVDFVKAHKALDSICEPFDHRCFNEVGPFKKISPTAENIAFYFAQEMSLLMGNPVTEVRVWEGPKHYAFFRTR